MTYETLVSTDIVASPAAAGWAIVDCRFDLHNPAAGRARYREAHVPGAVYASLSEDLSGPVDGRRGRHPLPGTAHLVALFSRLGIDAETQVVAYDSDTGMFASRLWWMLRAVGHDAVAVLDGGIGKWIAERRPTRGGDEQRGAATFVAQPRPAMIASLDDVALASGYSGALLIDARGADRYEGQTEPVDRVPGHIPAALNFPFRRNLAPDGTLLPADTLRAQFDALLQGHDPAATIMYCGSGVSACVNLLAMEHAGLHGAKLYPGSWSEWSADPARPIETGRGRR